ncbi:hypothetical protein DelCs14_1717 [Delftia sp. Cs1-4]|nr:hypothetical protein DelCs14_1717 [Delftia sp. Cs1-4]
MLRASRMVGRVVSIAAATAPFVPTFPWACGVSSLACDLPMALMMLLI